MSADVLNDPKQLIISLLDAIDRVTDVHSVNQHMVAGYDEEYNDLTHALELINFNGAQGFKLAKELKKNRQQRRQYKDHNLILQPVLNLLKRNPNLRHELHCCLNDIKQVEQNIETRGYRPRASNAVFTELINKTKTII